MLLSSTVSFVVDAIESVDNVVDGAVGVLEVDVISGVPVFSLWPHCVHLRNHSYIISYCLLQIKHD